MEDKKNKRKLFKRIGAIVGAVVVAIVAFSLPFLGKFDSKLNSIHLVASADSVGNQYVFTGSNNIQFNALISSDSTFREFLPLNVRFDLTTDLSSTVVITGHCHYYSGGHSVSKQTLVFNNKFGDVLDYPTFSYNTGEMLYMSSSREEFLNYGGFPFYVHVEGEFNSNVSFIQLGTGSFHYLTYGSSSLKAFFIKYVDVNNNYVYFEFVVPSDMEYNDRTYYLSPDLTDNQIYSQGYNDGLSANQDNVYKNGYNAGYNVGYNNGYSAGANAAGEYTFFGLVSAVIDAPIQAFMGLFNFELLGVNLAGFFTGLLTVAFIITIVRLIL